MKAVTSGDPAPSELSDAERAAFEQLEYFYKRGEGMTSQAATWWRIGPALAARG